MLVTLITPCLNPGWRIRRCIESVAAQRDVDVEHLVIDGGSTDGTVAWLSSLPDVRLVSESDSGQSEAINKGLRLARGDFVGWLNADDWLTEDALLHALRAVSEANADWAYGDVWLVSPESVTRRRSPRRLTRRLMERENPIPQPGVLIRREAMGVVGELDMSLNLAMDVDLWIRLIAAGMKSVSVARPLAFFEIHTTSKTGATAAERWLLEEAAVRARHGWAASAGFVLGRAAALSAPRDAHLDQRDLLRLARGLSPEVVASKDTRDTDIVAGALAQTALMTGPGPTSAKYATIASVRSPIARRWLVTEAMRWVGCRSQVAWRPVDG